MMIEIFVWCNAYSEAFSGALSVYLAVKSTLP